ncbi:Carbonic anhydrase 7 [Lamellibrachia satsuma]|nr:Carbonic anhydrase 7 [Lamellibrachia satsuma]
MKLHCRPAKQRIEYKILLLSFRAQHGIAPSFGSTDEEQSSVRVKGPDQWFKHHVECRGKCQSPIAIENSQTEYDPSLGAFDMTGYDVIQGVLVARNNGHTVQVSVAEASWWLTGGSLTGTYRLRQFHFHWGSDSNVGSEHTINPRRFPLEMHMVHVSAKYQSCSEALQEKRSIVVIAVLFESLYVAESHTNAHSERVFSMCRKIDTGSRSQLGHDTLRALLSCKINTDDPCYSIVPEKNLLKSATVATWDYVKVH